MTNVERIVSYTTEELDEMERRGETYTNFAYLDALTDEELEASIDYDEEGVPDWSTVMKGFPGFPRPLTLNVDRDVIMWFEARGPDVEERMARALREYIDERR